MKLSCILWIITHMFVSSIIKIKQRNMLNQKRIKLDIVVVDQDGF